MHAREGGARSAPRRSPALTRASLSLFCLSAAAGVARGGHGHVERRVLVGERRDQLARQRVLAARDGHCAALQRSAHQPLLHRHGPQGRRGALGGADLLPLHAGGRHLLPQGRHLPARHGPAQGQHARARVLRRRRPQDPLQARHPLAPCVGATRQAAGGWRASRRRACTHARDARGRRATAHLPHICIPARFAAVQT